MIYGEFHGKFFGNLLKALWLPFEEWSFVKECDVGAGTEVRIHKMLGVTTLDVETSGGCTYSGSIIVLYYIYIYPSGLGPFLKWSWPKDRFWG